MSRAVPDRPQRTFSRETSRLTMSEADRVMADVLSLDVAALLREVAGQVAEGVLDGPEGTHAYLSGAAAALHLRAQTAVDAQGEA